MIGVGWAGFVVDGLAMDRNKMCEKDGFQLAFKIAFKIAFKVGIIQEIWLLWAGGVDLAVRWYGLTKW